jgi:hypothetical protein
MNKIYDEFPVFLIENFYNIDSLNKEELIQSILENGKLFFNKEKGINFPIKNDNKKFFGKLYEKFYDLCEKKFIFTPIKKSSNACWAYVSDKNNFKEVWHNHLNTSTINGVYYLNIPENDYVTIDFELNGNIYTRKVKNHDLIIFPNYLNHKPNRCYKDGYRISINMEINCKESAEYIFNNMR